MSGFRRDKLASLIRQALGELINRQYPALANTLFSVSYIEVTPDISMANIFCTSIGADEELAEQLSFLQGQAGHIRHQISQQIYLKRTPTLRFMADKASQRSRRIEELLDKKA